MKKKLLKTFIYAGIIYIASKAFIVFSAFQILSSLKNHFKEDFLLTYSWVSSNINGSVSIEDIELTPYTMKKTFYIEKLSLNYQDYFSLVTQLSALKDGSIGALKSVSIPYMNSELKGKSVKALAEEKWGDKWFTPFDIYGCGELHNLSSDDYKKMGINKWQASLDLEISKNDQNMDVLSVELDQKELGKYQLVSVWPQGSIQEIVSRKDFAEASLQSLEIEHQEAGLFRRLNILCNKSGAENRSLYSANAALGWKNAMFAQGLLVNNDLVELYGSYLLQGGALSISAKADGGFKLNNLDSLINKELIDFFKVEINLNGRQFHSSELFVDGSIIYPPAKEIEIELPKTQELKFEPGYKIADLAFIDQHLDRKIRVTMLSDKVYEGLLSSYTEYNLELTHNLPGGVVNYPLMLNEIKTFEVWFNQE